MTENLNKYRENINTLRPYFPLTAALVISLLLAIGVSLPQIKNLITLSGDNSKSTAYFNSISKKATKLTDLLSLHEVLNSNLALVDDALPGEEMIPEMMNQIERISTESGVYLKGLYFGLKSADNKKVTEASVVSLQVEVHGPYANLRIFLENLEKSSRLITTENLRFDSIDTKEEGETLKATSTLVAYYVSKPKNISLSKPMTLDLSSKKLNETLAKLKELKPYRIKVETMESGKLNPFD